MNRVKPELLLPAGDMERLKIAFLYGADAVYIGGSSFGLRANAINFTLEEIKEASQYAHSLNKKLYVTINIVFHNKDVTGLLLYLKELDGIKVDAIIVSDPLVLEMAKEHTNLKVFISTQQSTLNYEAVAFWKDLGANRIIMGREASYNDIKEIKERCNIDLECFIHGAMCSGYSGRCVLSNFLTNRDANRGGCSQVCRWNFDLLDDKKEMINPVNPFTLCAKDLLMINYLKEMIEAGVSSFKVEGRMRSIYYIATVTNIYRKTIDRIFNDKEVYIPSENDEKELRRCANRDSICQFFNGINDETCAYYNNEEVSNQDFLGLVKGYDDGYIILEERNYFEVGMMVEIFGPNHNPYSFKINEIKDENNDIIDVVRNPGKIVKIKSNFEVEPNDMMRIKIS